jgi:hypothetical protein
LLGVERERLNGVESFLTKGQASEVNVISLGVGCDSVYCIRWLHGCCFCERCSCADIDEEEVVELHSVKIVGIVMRAESVLYSLFKTIIELGDFLGLVIVLWKSSGWDVKVHLRMRCSSGSRQPIGSPHCRVAHYKIYFTGTRETLGLVSRVLV